MVAKKAGGLPYDTGPHHGQIEAGGLFE